MPNGVDKNLRRLIMACALYRQRYGEWPSQARMPAGVLHDLASLLDDSEFAKLAAHLELRTKDKPSLSVGGSRGHVEYGQEGQDVDSTVLDLANQWLDLRVRRRPHGPA